MNMSISRRVRFGVVLAAVPLVIFSSVAQATAAVTRVLTMPAPNVPESIAIDHQGAIYMGIPFTGKVVKVTAGGTQTTIASFPGLNPLGVRVDHVGNVFVAVATSGVWEIPAGGGAKKQLAAGPGLWNGLAFDHRGNLFVSDSHAGAVWRMGKDGSFSVWSASSLLLGSTSPGPCGLVHPAVPSFGILGANGIALNKHGDMLVANTDLGTIVRIAMSADGSAGAATIFAGPSCDLWGADGVAMDNRDNLYVAANSKGQIDRVDPNGNLEVFAAGSPLNFPSDLAFGTGRGERTVMFISNFAAFPTSTGAPGVLKTDAGIPGRPIG
jgi:sugar lactone lactonase YvrE